jgi:hypothetical protein
MLASQRMLRNLKPPVLRVFGGQGISKRGGSAGESLSTAPLLLTRHGSHC